MPSRSIRMERLWAYLMMMPERRAVWLRFLEYERMFVAS